MLGKKPIKAKTFARAIWELLENPKLIEKYLQDQRPSFQEKIIIEALILLRDNQFIEIESKIAELTLQDPLVDAIRNLVLGIALNNSGKYVRAEKCLVEAYRELRNYEARPLIFLTSFNAFICFLNLQKFDESKTLKDEIFKLKAQSPLERHYQLRIACLQALSEGNPDEAEVYLFAIEASENTMTESGRASFFYDKFLYHLLKKNLRAARELVMEMKTIKKFYHSPNFIFMKNLLDYLIDEKVFYFYEREFKETSFLWWQVSVLQKLVEKDRPGAKIFWDELAEVSPHIYAPDFSYQGNFCLFQLVLKKVNYVEKSLSLPVSKGDSKEDQVTVILQHSENGVRKDELYKLIYGTEADTKDDMNKLKAVIMRARKKGNIEIKTRKGCYYIPSKKELAS